MNGNKRTVMVSYTEKRRKQKYFEINILNKSVSHPCSIDDLTFTGITKKTGPINMHWPENLSKEYNMHTVRHRIKTYRLNVYTPEIQVLF